MLSVSQPGSSDEHFKKGGLIEKDDYSGITSRKRPGGGGKVYNAELLITKFLRMLGVSEAAERDCCKIEHV